MGAAVDVELRPFAASDRAAVDALLDPDGAELFANQFHPLHGEDADGDRWRRTRLACTADGTVVAAGTIARNRLHGGRYTLAVETAPEHRRRGIATLLVRELLELRAEPIPLAAKVFDHDRAAVAFARAIGFRTYQRCPGLVPDPCDAQVRAWTDRVLADPSAPATTDLVGIDPAVLAAAYAERYVWEHRAWSPVTSTERMREAAEATVEEADLELSRAVVRDGRPVAVAWVFHDDGDAYELVAETTREREPDGVGLVRAVVASSLQALAEAGARRVDIDGHADDPHLPVVLAELPEPCACEPLDLVELDRAPATNAEISAWVEEDGTHVYRFAAPADPSASAVAACVEQVVERWTRDGRPSPAHAATNAASDERDLVRALEGAGFAEAFAQAQLELSLTGAPSPSSDSAVEVTEPRRADLADLWELNEVVYAGRAFTGVGTQEDRDRFVAEAGDLGLWRVACEDGRPVAFVAASIDPEDAARGVIEELSVHPSLRRRGIGRALLTVGLELLRERGVGTVHLVTDRDDASGARTLYEQFGFRLVRVEGRYRLPLGALANAPQ